MRVSLVATGLPVLCALALGACSPKVPDSGVGFSDYNSYIRSATPAPAPAAQAAVPATTGFSTDSAAAAIDAATGTPSAAAPGAPLTVVSAGSVAATTLPASSDPAFDPNRSRGDAPATIAADSGEMVNATGYASGGLSDEQSFKAVTERTSIEGDKERIAANRAQYVVIQPADIPMRPDNTGPDIVKYALATTNPVGVKLYDRPSFYLVNINRSCQKYTSPDFAQQAFLAAGGPTKDPKGLDPDGDGFACYWDPAPFRAALQ